ncbi:lipoprotein 17-related variable surface protein [Mycoplasmopsis gallinacea]|uniref:ECM-binding protein homolog n=1 Tax=Mycoplasmopsis gallinacea TaxID=29556 RepID=A0A449A284_9BACT|nr:lipoprotein 17-related variable surface protein [Mycoplasmopsis gallinacea]VEU58342.1 ECM-binding protein homolog [Mycoplasmopsis gallinacea]
MKNKALKRSLLIVPASVPLIGLVLPLSMNTSSNNVSIETSSGASWTFDQVNINVQDNIWKNYNSLQTSNHNARYAPYRYINIFNSNGNLNFNDENSNWQYRAVGDSWFRLFDASNPGFPNNVNVSDWTGSGYATESGTLYSWQVDGFSNQNVDYGPWWNGNGYNPGADTKRFKIGYNLVNKPLHGSATHGAQSTFYTGAFYFSNDMKLASDIKIHLYIKVDDRNNSTVLKQKTYTIKLKEEKNATLSDYDISPWIGKVQKVNKDSLQASKNGDSLEAWLTNYAYLPYYQNTPSSYTSGLSSDLLQKKRTWDNYKTSDKHNGMYDILVSTPTNMSDIRSNGFKLSENSGTWTNFGLYQKNLISNARPANIIYNNQGGLFVFNIEMNKKLDYLVAGAVAEVEFEPYNDVANPSNTTFFGNTGSSTGRKSFFGSAEYREKNDDGDQRIVSGFWKIADRSESQLKKFYTLETIDSALGSDIYNPNSDAFPATTLRITENGNSNINYDISKNRINRNKKTISTKSIYQDTKAVKNTNALRLKSTISSADAKKWKVKSGSSLTSTPLSSSRFDSNGIEFSPIVYTYTDLELAKRYVDAKQWLNKGQKDYLKILLDNESGFTASNQYSKSALLTEWKAKIDTLDKQQKAIEEKYKEIRDFPLSNNVYDSSYNANITNKIIYALATQSSKNSLDSVISRNINKINFRSSEYNTESGAIDRTTSTEYSISSPSGASYNSLKTSMDAVYNALDNNFTAVKNSGKTEIEKYFARVAQYPITEQNSSTYSGNYNKAKNLIIKTIKAQVKNLSSKSELNPFVNLDATNKKINAIIDLISKVNKLNNHKNSVKSQIETYKQPQNDFNNLGSFEFASSTSQIDLKALDTFDKNLTNASDKTIQNIFASTAILTKFYNDNNEIFAQQWIEKAKGLDGAINEFDTEIDKFNYLYANQKSSAKNALQSALSSNKIFTYNENTATLSVNNEFIKKINDQMTSAFATAKTTAKNQISALDELTETEKTQVKQEIDNATLYKDNYDANQPFADKILIGSDKNIKIIVDKWTDINNERARTRIKDYTATFDYPNKNIEPTTAQQNLVSQQSISPDANGLETEIISINGNNDTGTLTVTYRIVKSSDKTNVYTQNKTFDITGFANEQNQKDAAKKAIDNYKYLNDAQKTALKNEIDQANLDQLDQIAQNASDLNDAMKAYNDATNNIETIKQSTDYTQADNQNALDNAVNQQKTDVNKTQGSNLSLQEVKNRTKAIQNAISNLNGDERLQKAKDDAIAKINSDYSSLTDKQKEKAIALINEQTTIDGVTSQDGINSALNSSMKTLRDYIENQNNVTAGNNYTYTTNALREAYDGNPTKDGNQKGGVIKEAEDLLDALNTDNNDNLMNKSNIDLLNNKIQTAINNLNGQQRYEKELARLNDLSLALAKVKDANQATDTASEVDTNEVEFIASTMPENVTTVDLVISNTNEVTGKLDLSYKYQSTKENLETVKSTKVYTLNNNNALSTLTEEVRLNNLIDNDSVAKTISFNGNNQNQVAVEEVNTSSFIGTIDPTNEAEIVIESVEEDPNDPHAVLVTYKLQSTKDNLGDQTVVSKTKQVKIDGFMSNKEKEQQTINTYTSANFVGTPDSKKLASSFVASPRNVNITFATNDNANHTNETIEIQSVKSWDDVNGTLTAVFVVKSNKHGEELTSTNKEITITGYFTEEQRLNNLIDNKDKEFNFSGTKAKDKTTVDEVTKDNLSGYLAEQLNGQLTNINNQNNVELVIDEITKKNPDGTITFNYHLKSTRSDIQNNTVVSKTLSATMSGFQSNLDREKADLDAKTNDDLNVVIDKTQMASSFSPDQIQLNPKDNIISVVDKTITGYNDVIGSIKLTYKLKSNKNGQDVYSEPKEIIITGLKTEAQRLNELLNNLVEGDITFNGTKNNQLPSVSPANDKANYSYDETKQNTNKASAFINSITPDDSTGQNTLNLKLVTTKTQDELISNWNVTNYEAPESQSKDLVITGFRTQAQQNKIDQDAEKARLTNLVANAQITYPNGDQILASSSVVSAIHKVINSTDNNAEIIIQNITDQNDLNGSITVAYVIHSTKGGIYENVNTDVQTVVLNNFKTEQQRLDALFLNKVATASLTGIDTANYRQYLPEEVLDHLTLAVADLENARVEIVSKTPNNQTNSIDYKYRLVSTRGMVSGHDLNTVTSTETKSGSLVGFKTLAQAEKERLDKLNPNATDDGYTHTIDYSNRNQILASKVQISDQNWTWSVEPNTDHTFSDQKIIAYDDITGKLRVRYKLQSTKSGLSDVKSEYKYATLTGYKTELTRLNDLVKQANQPVAITAKDEAKKDGTDQKKASQLTSDDFNATLTEYGQNENVKIETILDTQNANNETGTIQLGYKLISTRPLTGTDGLISGTWDDTPQEAPTIKSETSNPLSSFDGYVTNNDEEENRIERLIANLVIDYPGKEQWLPLYNQTNVIPSGVQVKLSNNRELNAEGISIKENSMKIVTRDDRKGEITVSYTLVSNSRQDVEVEINQTRSKNANTITGFKTELQRLDELTYSWENAIQNKSTISPSDVDLSNITPVSTNDDQAKDVVITSFDDRTGTLNVQYNIYSKRTDLTDIHVVNKAAQITGLQTELQRLNALIVNDQVSKTINYVPNDKTQIKASSLVAKKAEVLANNDNSYFTTLIQDPATSKAKIIIKDITSDDETGQLTVKYVLQSTKDNLTDIDSDTENTVEISGFLSNLQEAKNNLKAKIDELVQNNKLTSEQAQALKDKIDSNETDSIDKVNKIELEADKQVLVNEVEKDFVHLNKAQLADVINKINEAATLEEAKTQKAAGQTLDDKMAKLDEIVKNYEAKKQLDKYTYASETPKNAFDKVIEDAKKLLDKTNATDLGTDNLDNWIGNEETNTKGEIQTKYEALDGDIQKAIEEVTDNEYLSPKQKEDLINKLNSLDPNTLEKANDDGTKLTLNDIKDEIAQIEALKKEAINRIKAYENLNPQQKDAYINQIKSSDNNQLETIENNATALDNKMLELKQAIENVKDVPNSSAYQNADQNNKDAFDNALNVANKIKNGKENTDPNDTFNYNANLDAVQKAIDDLKLANTNINRDEALKYVDNAPYLSADEKVKFKEQLNQNPITDETIAKLKEQAQIINDAKKVYVDQIKAIDNNDLDQNNKDEYINQIINKEMTLDENNVITNPEEFSKIVFDAQKEALMNKIENNVNQPDLPNILNPKQLNEAKEAINNATDLAEAQKAYEDAINLSKKMAALDELVKNYEKSIADPNNTKYNKADNKEQFDNKLTEAKKLLTSDSDNGVDNKLLEDLLSNNDKSLQHSYEELNGLENDLIEQINNSEVLSPNEKADLIAQVNNIDKHNDEPGQVATLQEKLNKLIADKNNNIKAIQNLENLNQSQKDDLINRIKNNDLIDNPAILDEAQNLDNKMKELKDEIGKENIIKGLSHYNKASEEKRNNYENALNNAKKLVNNETPNGYNSANTSFAETQEILDKLKQAFKAIDDEAKKINDLYDKLNAKIIEYQKDVDNKELPKEIQDILDELVNYGEDVNGIDKLIELIKQGKSLKSLHEQWNNSDVKNPDTEKAIEDLNAKINSVTELINLIESSNLNSKLDTSKDFVLNHNQYNINFAEAEISYFDALKNVDKTKFIDATNKLEQLEQTKFVEFANSILNTSYFDTYKPESNLNKKLIKELLKLNYYPLNKMEKSLFEILLKEKAGVEEKLSWLWYLALGLSTTLAAIMIGVLVKKVKNNS